MVYFVFPFIVLFVFDVGDKVSRELSFHPVHLTPDKEGNLPPSALVPFCFYQAENSLLGRMLPEMGNMTVCDKFQPTLLEGELCYSLDIAKITEHPRTLTRSDKSYGLFLLLDPHPYQLNHTDEINTVANLGEQTFKVFIHTLEQYTSFGPGSFGMSALKKMTGTTSFKYLPDYQRKCFVHNREECQTKKYFDQLKKECKCIPWSLQINQVKKLHKNIYSYVALGGFLVWPRERDLCCKPNHEG